MQHIKQSFYDWCITNNRQDIISRWDYKLNLEDPHFIPHATVKLYYFKCPKGIHKSELKRISDFVYGHEGVMECKACNSFAQWGIDNVDSNFLKKYWDYNKNCGINPWVIGYCSHKNVWIYCQNDKNHGSYNISVDSFEQGHRCVYCTHQARNKYHHVPKEESLGFIYPEVWKIWSKNNKKTPNDYYPGSNKEIVWNCKIHGNYYRSIKSSKNAEFRCPFCSVKRTESFIQEKVRTYLECSYPMYPLFHERNCTLIPQNPKIQNKRGELPFDNELIINGNHLLIEVHGSQHYTLSSLYKLQAKKMDTTPKYELHRTQLHDRYKKYVAYCNGYFYLAIPYWLINHSEAYKKLINDKIAEILSIQNIKSA